MVNTERGMGSEAFKGSNVRQALVPVFNPQFSIFNLQSSIWEFVGCAEETVRRVLLF